MPLPTNEIETISSITKEPLNIISQRIKKMCVLCSLQNFRK